MKGEFACVSNGALASLLRRVPESAELPVVNDHEPESIQNITNANPNHLILTRLRLDDSLRKISLISNSPQILANRPNRL
jgi:hypothetical protein